MLLKENEDWMINWIDKINKGCRSCFTEKLLLLNIQNPNFITVNARALVPWSQRFVSKISYACERARRKAQPAGAFCRIPHGHQMLNDSEV